MTAHFNVGDLVRIKALPGISMATLFDGQIGIVARLPIEGSIDYEVYVDDRTLWLIPAELEVLQVSQHIYLYA